MSKIERKKIVIPTYPIGKAEPLPLFFEKRPYQGASGKLYPIPYTSGISDEKTDKAYDSILLENDYIRVTLLPEIGGKIHSAYDKTSDYDFIYHNKVIKPAMVGLAGCIGVAEDTFTSLTTKFTHCGPSALCTNPIVD